MTFLHQTGYSVGVARRSWHEKVRHAAAAIARRVQPRLIAGERP